MAGRLIEPSVAANPVVSYAFVVFSSSFCLLLWLLEFFEIFLVFLLSSCSDEPATLLLAEADNMRLGGSTSSMFDPGLSLSSVTKT